MASLRNRLSAVWNALVRGSPGMADYASGMVRPYEESNQLSRYTQSTARDLVRRFNGYVKTCQMMNASGVASVKLGVYRRTGSGRKSVFEGRPISRKELARQRHVPGPITRKAAEMDDSVEEIIDPYHPIVSLLRTANPLMNGFQLIEQTQLGTGLTGDHYWHAVPGPDGYPSETWPLMSQFVRPLPSRDTMVTGYVFGRGQEVERIIPASEIIRFTQPNPRGDPFRGMGDLEACLLSADLAEAFNLHRIATLDNGAAPGGFVIAKNMVGEKPREQLENQVNRKYTGVSKAGRIWVLTGEVQWVPNQMGDKEMAFLGSEDQVRETIANCHDIPIVLLTMRDSGALAAAKAARESWQERGLLPRCTRIQEAINQHLIPMFFENPKLGARDVYVCFEEVVSKDLDATSVRVTASFGADILTKNEARAELGYDAVPDGDKFKSEYAAEQAQEAATQMAQAGAGDPGKPVPGDAADAEDPAAKGLGPQSTGHRILRPAHGHSWSQSAMLVSGEASTCCLHHPAVVRKDAAMDRVDSQARVGEVILRQWFLKITPMILGAIADKALGVPIRTKDDRPRPTFDMPPGVAVELEAVMRPILEAVGKSGYNFGVIELGPKAGPAQIQMALTKPVADFLRTYTGQVIRSVTETVDTQIRQALAAGIEAGESIPQLKARIQGLMTDMSGMGAERIARTESARAFTAARVEAWRTSGNVWGKRWLLAGDACPFCRDLAAQYNKGLPLSVNFADQGDTLVLDDGAMMQLDYSDTHGPPLHPNCRCALTPVFEEPK